MQYPQLNCGLRPKISNPEDEWAMLEPGKYTCCNDIEKWRRFNNDDIWTTNGFSSKERRETSKGKLCHNALQKTLVCPDIPPYSYSAHSFKIFFFQYTTPLFHMYYPSSISSHT